MDRADDVRALIKQLASAPDAYGDDVPLIGGNGLGFDSVRVVELLLLCEERFGVKLSIEALLADPSTVLNGALLIARVSASPRP